MLYNAFTTMGKRQDFRLRENGFTHCGRFYRIEALTDNHDGCLMVRVFQKFSETRQNPKNQTRRLLALKGQRQVDRLSRQAHLQRKTARRGTELRSGNVSKPKAIEDSLEALSERCEIERALFTFRLRMPDWRDEAALVGTNGPETRDDFLHCYHRLWQGVIDGLILHLPRHKRYLEGLRHAALDFRGNLYQQWVRDRATRRGSVVWYGSTDMPRVVTLEPMREPQAAIFRFPYDVQEHHQVSHHVRFEMPRNPEPVGLAAPGGRDVELAMQRWLEANDLTQPLPPILAQALTPYERARLGLGMRVDLNGNSEE